MQLKAFRQLKGPSVPVMGGLLNSAPIAGPSVPRLTAAYGPLLIVGLEPEAFNCQGLEVSLRFFVFCAFSLFSQGQVSAEGILHLVNPNSGSNSGMRIFEPRISGPNSGVEFFGPMFSNKKRPPKNSPSRNSPPKIHIKKFTPELGLKNSHCTSAGPFF